MKREPGRTLGVSLTALSALKFVLDQTGRWQALMWLRRFLPPIWSAYFTAGLFVVGIIILLGADWLSGSRKRSAHVGLVDQWKRPIESGGGARRLGMDALLSVAGGLLIGLLLASVFWISGLGPASKPGHILFQRFTPLPAVAGEPVRVNIFYVNDGSTNVEGEWSGAVNFAPVTPMSDDAALAVVEDQIYSYVKSLEKSRHDSIMTLNRGVKFWSTLTGPVLDSAHVEGLKYNSVLFAAGVFKYRTPSQPDTQFCIYWQDPQVVHLCKAHNN
jgi:hypothetical protein